MIRVTDLYHGEQNDYVGVDVYDSFVQVDGTLNGSHVDLTLTSMEARALAAALVHYAGEMEAGRA